MRSLLILLSLLSFSILSLAQLDNPAFENLDVFELEYASDPRISPNGKAIVYVRRGLDIMTDKAYGRLWILNSDGSDHRKLSSREINESSP